MIEGLLTIFYLFVVGYGAICAIVLVSNWLGSSSKEEFVAKYSEWSIALASAAITFVILYFTSTNGTLVCLLPIGVGCVAEFAALYLFKKC